MARSSDCSTFSTVRPDDDFAMRSVIAPQAQRAPLPCLGLLPHRLALPHVPGARLLAGGAVARGAFFRRDVADRAADAERDRLQPRIDLGVDGADHRPLAGRSL